MLVTERTQALQERVGDHPHSAFALDRLDQDRGRLRRDGALDHFDVTIGNVVKPSGDRTEAIQIFLVASRGERGQRAAVKRALESDDPETLRMSGRGMMLAGNLD